MAGDRRDGLERPARQHAARRNAGIAAIDHLFVITGGPGSGKSTLIEALAARGFAHSTEAGRAVIREQQAIGGHALPWNDRLAFAEAMRAHDEREHSRLSAQTGPVFCDRGLPDIVGYLTLERLAVPSAIEDSARALRYNPLVFIAPHWPEIYVSDAERRQTPDIAERTFAVMAETYPRYGYELVALPRATIDDRVSFILERVR